MYQKSTTEDEEMPQAIVLDLGSYIIKAGFSGHDSPKVTYPTLIGHPRDPGLLNGMDQKDFYTGREALSKKHLLKLTEPIVEGAIANFEDLEKILDELVKNELKWTFED